MYLRSKRRQPALHSVGDDADLVQGGGDVAGFTMPVVWPNGGANTEAWRPLVEEYAGTLPINFLLKWIDWESAGNPCSWTYLKEAGIFQLEPPDNLAVAHTTMAQQHPTPPCVNGVQTSAGIASLTKDQAIAQVQGGINYVNYCRDKARGYLKAAGYTWSESDWSFWAAVKWIHIAPAFLPKMLQQGIDGFGGVPPDWLAMTAFVTGMPDNWLQNAYEVGLLGQGGGRSLLASLGKTTTYVMLAATAVALVVLLKQQTRRVAH